VIVAESETSAVVYGMPGAVVRAGLVSRSMSLIEIADWLAAL
jgi:two-component system chemotaxis response regulator CheB